MSLTNLSFIIRSIYLTVTQQNPGGGGLTRSSSHSTMTNNSANGNRKRQANPQLRATTDMPRPGGVLRPSEAQTIKSTSNPRSSTKPKSTDSSQPQPSSESTKSHGWSWFGDSEAKRQASAARAEAEYAAYVFSEFRTCGTICSQYVATWHACRHKISRILKDYGWCIIQDSILPIALSWS